MNRTEKMLKVMHRIITGNNFKKEKHMDIICKGNRIGYYYVDDIFFTLKHIDVEVNVNGAFGLGGLDSYAVFDFDYWLDELVELVCVEEKMITIKGKEYSEDTIHKSLKEYVK